MFTKEKLISKKRFFIIFLMLNCWSLCYADPSLAMRYGLQLGTITGLAIANGNLQGTITLGDSMKGHIYYLKRSGRNMYYGMGTIVDFDNFLDSDSKGGILLTKGKKGKKGKGGGGGGGGGNGNALDDLLLRIPVGFSTYISPALVFFELGFYVLGGKGSDSVLGVRFYF